MTDFKTSRELAGFLNAVVMPTDHVARYIDEYCEYYYNMKMLEVVADIRNQFEENRKRHGSNKRSDRRA